MSLTLRRENTGTAPARYVRDPFALARELFAWDPYARAATAFAPSFDVKETAEAFVVRADLPGVEEKDLDVSIHNGVLTITGSRQAEERKEGESFYLYERQFGSFSRSFALPEIADAEKIGAQLRGGVLELSIGKRAEAKPRKIEIKK
ncbi:MAG: Hsp20/alpha crystallin family protein [Myxococcales bacterium]|jgi:HSP20 family protein|nr:Hsp20/alpha crystallin family protein [Myxococcales bacterium]HRC57278.1 Hsp20/alpha crystallin family protein [Kofleriaceae bacterium]